MRGDLVGDHSLPHVFRVGKAEVLLRRDVAEHVRPEPADHRRADRARDVVVAGRDVGDERTERIERRLVADLFHAADVHLDLVHRDVSRALYHHLHVALPRTPSQLAECVELRELRAVAGVGDASGTQAVAERDCDVVLAKDVEHVVESLVERILLAVRHHPHRVERAPAAHDAGDAPVHEREMLDQNSGVERHVIDALLCLMLDHVEQVVGGELLELLVPFAVGSALHRLVDRDRSDWNWRCGDDRAADSVDIAAGGEIHDRIGPVLDRDLELLDLAIHVGRDLGVADVGVDLHPRHLADRHRLECAREVVNVGGDDEPADGDLVAHQLGRKLLALGDEAHRVRDLAPTRVMHLCDRGGPWRWGGAIRSVRRGKRPGGRLRRCCCFHRSTPYAGTNRIRF